MPLTPSLSPSDGERVVPRSEDRVRGSLRALSRCASGGGNAWTAARGVRFNPRKKPAGIAGRRGAAAARRGLMHWSLIYLISEWSIRLVMLVYVPQRRNAAASRTWLLLIFLLPWPGLAVYAMFGRIRVSRGRIEQQLRASQRIRRAQAELGVRNFAGPKLPADSAPLLKLAARLGDFEPFGGNRIELLKDYGGAIDRLLADIEGRGGTCICCFTSSEMTSRAAGWRTRWRGRSNAG